MSSLKTARLHWISETVISPSFALLRDTASFEMPMRSDSDQWHTVNYPCWYHILIYFIYVNLRWVGMSVCAPVATARVDIRGQLEVVILSFVRVSPGLELGFCELVAGVFPCWGVLLSPSILVKWAAFIGVMITVTLDYLIQMASMMGTLGARCLNHCLHWWMTMTLECILPADISGDYTEW